MASNCSDYFSVWDLEGNSRETEVTQSTHCLPNRVKFGLMLLWLVVHTVILVFILGHLTKEVVASKRWTLQKRTLTLLALCTIGKRNGFFFR